MTDTKSKKLRPSVEITYITVLQKLKWFGYIIQPKNTMGGGFVFMHLEDKAKEKCWFKMQAADE